MKRLFTIGYEHATQKDFFAALLDAKVATLVDVRAVAGSRRPGFSKRQLAAGLDSHGMSYVHLQKLGTPKQGRLAARSGKAEEMLRIYERHLATPEAQHELDELTALAKSGRPLCLCYECDPAHCHRGAKSVIPACVSSRVNPKSRPSASVRRYALACERYFHTYEASVGERILLCMGLFFKKLNPPSSPGPFRGRSPLHGAMRGADKPKGNSQKRDIPRTL
jgi:hypothetical protein